MSLVFIRTVLLYILIVFSLRIMGKRQLGELQPSDLVVTILISNIATLPIEDVNIPLISGVIPILTFVALEVLISVISLKWDGARKLVSGSPKIIIQNGVINQKELKKLRFSIDDLMEQLRSKDVFDIADVDFAIVETTGQVSIYKKFAKQNVTAQMLSVTPSKQDLSFPYILIKDGKINYEGLVLLNLEKKWLENVLKNEKIQVQDVFLFTADRTQKYSLIKKQY